MRIDHLIDGRTVASAETFETRDPATQEVLAEVSSGGLNEVNQAVAAAKAAFPKWAATPATDRAKIMRKAAELLRERFVNTLLLVAAGQLIAFAVGTALGTLAAARAGSRTDRTLLTLGDSPAVSSAWYQPFSPTSPFFSEIKLGYGKPIGSIGDDDGNLYACFLLEIIANVTCTLIRVKR